MIDLKEINEEIQKLENSKTSHDTCFKLSYLYVVKDHLENKPSTLQENKVPDYVQGAKRYVETKAQNEENIESCPILGDVTFCNLVKSKGNKKILETLALYMQHLRAYKPSEYSRLMDKLTNA